METVIAAALLHDVMDTKGTQPNIQEHVGKEVANIVNAVERLSRNNQLLRRDRRRKEVEGRTAEAAADVDVAKDMILQMTEDPLVRFEHRCTLDRRRVECFHVRWASQCCGSHGRFRKQSLYRARDLIWRAPSRQEQGNLRAGTHCEAC